MKKDSNWYWSFAPHVLYFKQPAGTSRGVYTTRKVWYLSYSPFKAPDALPIGECAPLPGLSCDDVPEYETILQETCNKLNATGSIDWEALRPYPSILFGFEMAFRYLDRGCYRLWDTRFSQGKVGIRTNGLIWMGERDFMLRQIDEKLNDGFRCIKLKIGAIGFDEELQLIRYIREYFSHSEIEIRVDANGAFSPEEAPDKLKRLADLGVSSIEQPIRAGQWDEMAYLVDTSPIAIALDEELIGLNTLEEKINMLDHICPRYIVLKPSLHGGFSGIQEWIDTADEYSPYFSGWWVTSALESNIGLNAIAQWCGTTLIPGLESCSPSHGLGTGRLFTNNIYMPLQMRGDHLWYTGHPDYEE